MPSKPMSARRTTPQWEGTGDMEGGLLRLRFRGYWVQCRIKIGEELLDKIRERTSAQLDFDVGLVTYMHLLYVCLSWYLIFI